MKKILVVNNEKLISARESEGNINGKERMRSMESTENLYLVFCDVCRMFHCLKQNENFANFGPCELINI